MSKQKQSKSKQVEEDSTCEEVSFELTDSEEDSDCERTSPTPTKKKSVVMKQLKKNPKTPSQSEDEDEYEEEDEDEQVVPAKKSKSSTFREKSQFNEKAEHKGGRNEPKRQDEDVSRIDRLERILSKVVKNKPVVHKTVINTNRSERTERSSLQSPTPTKRYANSILANMF